MLNMNEINHQVGIKSSAEELYDLLTTDTGLAKWWTNDVSGAGGVGSIIEFRFNGGGPDFSIAELVPNKTVRWKHSGSIPEAWMGTEVSFEIIPDQQQIFVRFKHSHWKDSTDFMAHCSTKWAVFLLSLKQAAEFGQGKPFPNDIHIDHS
jgi:uncharacterized protein YndB with AHSA1/START domain